MFRAPIIGRNCISASLRFTRASMLWCGRLWASRTCTTTTIAPSSPRTCAALAIISRPRRASGCPSSSRARWRGRAS
eukprot:456828-Pyramimonas_sp.AAC.1